MADANEVLVHSCAVYLYAYDAEKGTYTQQSDAAVGAALFASRHAAPASPTASSSAMTARLVVYNAAKQPLVQMPLAPAPPSPRFTPQPNHYVSFYDQTQRNFSMRFKDAAAVTAFLRAAALTKAQMLVLQDPASHAHAKRAWITLAEDIDLGKADAHSGGNGLSAGDVAGIAWTMWQDAMPSAGGDAAFFSSNPMEIMGKPAMEFIPRDGELKRVSVGDDSADMMARALSDVVQGMRKHMRRVVTIVLPSSQQWIIAELELVKVKKAKGRTASASASSSASPVAKPSLAPLAISTRDEEDDVASAELVAAHANGNDELVQRMAQLSRAGSLGSGLIASLTPRGSRSGDLSLDKPDVRRQSSNEAMEQAIATPGYGRIPLVGISNESLQSSRASMRRGSDIAPPPAEPVPREEPLPRASTSTSTNSNSNSNTSTSTSTTSTANASALQQMRQEQADLDQLRRQLDESKRKLAAHGTSGEDDAGTTTTLTVAPPPTSSANASDWGGGYAPWRPPPSILTTPLPSSSLPATSTTGSSYTSVPSSSFLPPQSSAMPAPLFAPSLSSYHTGRSGPYPSSSSSSSALIPAGGPASSSLSNPEVESSLLRLQRSSTSIESTLHDLQAKMDRLLNGQHASWKQGPSSRYALGASSSSTTSASSALAASTGGSSSSSSLLKNLERALTQRDQLQDTNTQLLNAREEMESTLEEYQSQHEALQLENRHLLDKLQNGNHMQQEKFRLELRNVQQQLSHAQEQMLAYQEENYRLRQEVAAKDELVRHEKAQLQDETRKQLEQLQRQLQDQVQLESKETMARLQHEKMRAEQQVADAATQRTQLEREREALAAQVQALQSQQASWAEERSQQTTREDERVQLLQQQLEGAQGESAARQQQVERAKREIRELEEVVAARDDALVALQQAKNQDEYAALSELLKEFMNDIYFHFQDAFEEEAEFTGREIVMAIRKILKQNTMEILAKLEEFWQHQHQQQQQ